MPEANGNGKHGNNGNGQVFKIPALVLITAFVVSLLAIARWVDSTTRELEHKKADRVAVEALEKKIDMLIEMHLREGYQKPKGYEPRSR